jgi:hypothetical protein
MKTAVEWFVEEMFNQGYLNDKPLTVNNIEYFVKQAKEMFEEQVILSHINGQSEFDKGAISENTKKLAEQYYNATFKSE